MTYESNEYTITGRENRSLQFLEKDTPAILHIAGEQYKNFIRKFQKPYDPIFLEAMQDTLEYLCRNIPGCVFGYAQSFDFILVLRAPQEAETPSWFSYDVQRIAALSSSMATLTFNNVFAKSAKSYVMAGKNFDETKKLSAMQGYVSAIDKGALFTADCSNIPAEEILSYLYRHQKTSIENAVFEAGCAYFKEEELAGKTAAQIQFMLFDRTGINFDDYPAEVKRGAACFRNISENGSLLSEAHAENEWIIDHEMPMFREENQPYIGRFIE